VEINPFLCPLTDLLPDPLRPLRVVHMVREPASWAQSITAFRASEQYRGIIDFLPFAKPYPAPRPPGWRQLNDFEKALWRWRWCNERIVNLRSACDAYVVVRYEELFSENIAEREAVIASIFETLDLPKVGRIDWPAYSTRINPRPPDDIQVDQEATQRICGALARELGYAD